jgi:hypothetical protein
MKASARIVGSALCLLGISLLVIPVFYPLSTLMFPEPTYITIPKDGDMYQTLKQVTLLAPLTQRITKVEFWLDNSLLANLQKCEYHVLSLYQDSAEGAAVSDYQDWSAKIATPSIQKHYFEFKVYQDNLQLVSVEGYFTIIGEPINFKGNWYINDQLVSDGTTIKLQTNKVKFTFEKVLLTGSYKLIDIKVGWVGAECDSVDLVNKSDIIWEAEHIFTYLGNYSVKMEASTSPFVGEATSTTINCELTLEQPIVWEAPIEVPLTPETYQSKRGIASVVMQGAGVILIFVGVLVILARHVRKR